jgi:curved DNA-binding protein CbpA
MGHSPFAKRLPLWSISRAEAFTPNSPILAEMKRCLHTGAMTLDSKIFVGLKSTRKKSAPHSEPTGPKCQWDGCEKSGTHRAPVGRDAEGLYLLFCLEHVKEYNKGYNFATGLSDADIARYQKEAATGGRPTWGTGVSHATEIPIPSTVRSGTAKTLNARKTAAQRKAQRANSQIRKLKVLEAKAFETLGLSADANPDEIKSRYKERLKLHHPDANQGDRTSEDELRASIEAPRIHKLNGFC